MTRRISKSDVAHKEDRIIRVNELVEITGLSKPTIWRLERAGKFPKKKRLGLRAVGWSAAEVINWMDNLEIK